MKYIIWLIFSVTSLLYGVSLYDIQYTTNPGPNGTYPSPYEGQIIITSGVVWATDFDDGKFFITDFGGDWSGIYVYDNVQSVVVGDSVIIEAEVYEYWGFTELSNLISCEVVSAGNSYPAILISTISNAVNESRESTKVIIGYYDVTITDTYDDWGQWKVEDASAECTIGTGFINLGELDIPLVVDYPLTSISGFVTFFWEEFQLNPIGLNSISSSAEDHIISISEQLIFSSEEFEVSIYHTVFNDGEIQSYQFDFNYNSDVMEYAGYELNGTLSNGGTIQVDQISAGTISVQFDGDFSFENMETLLKMNFNGLESGSADLGFSDFFIDDILVEYFSVDEVILLLESIPIGDTLTVIQKPLLNIPAMVVPGEELQIECVADPSTTNWTAILQHEDKIISLNITNASYNNDLERWQLLAVIPTPDIYEMYNLIVSATGIVTDTTKNAVNIIPNIKDEYYFVHITDSHLPTHIFYPDPQSLTDTTEVTDLREVINDINLINPEFVLITGDLINEGEMEDFENRRVYTKAQQMLSEFEVPVYLVTGNHDVGGWDSSPPSQGTARRDWWRFFGWNWLSDPPAAEPYYTQNYSFNYGPTHFIGMDAYINYDSYMYNIFGGESFTDLQMQWLENDLLQNSASESFVMFYHYDFSDQIDLENLGVDMALWGHIHSNSGSIYNYPYNLATESTCDGNRAYRVIYVNDTELQPTATVYAGWDGEELHTTFIPENNGLADSVFCSVENSHNLDFSEAQLKFIMPGGAGEYLVYNGTILQIDESGEYAICYVLVELSANGNTSVSVVADFDASAENQLQLHNFQLTNYPNPFNPDTTISFELNTQNTKVTALLIYNVKGQKIKEFRIMNYELGINEVIWDGTDENDKPQPSGIYIVKLQSENRESLKKIMLLK